MTIRSVVKLSKEQIARYEKARRAVDRAKAKLDDVLRDMRTDDEEEYWDVEICDGYAVFSTEDEADE